MSRRRSRPVWFERFYWLGSTPVTWEGFLVLFVGIGAAFGASEIGPALARLGVTPDLRHLAATGLGVVAFTCLLLALIFTGPRRY